MKEKERSKEIQFLKKTEEAKKNQKKKTKLFNFFFEKKKRKKEGPSRKNKTMFCQNVRNM